ncbi:MAG TPA: hypothetical protein PKE29_18830 [Phycisphaerales bacterium]|nr:hypothetical protein [Phycisphaerales bacterium]
MADAKSVLSPEDYKNYRNIRAIALLFVVFGGLWALVGTALAIKAEPAGDDLPSAFYAVMAVVGGLGAIGGFCTFTGIRRLAPLIYIFGFAYLLAVPIGPILGYVLFKGLRKYLNSVEQVRAAGP